MREGESVYPLTACNSIVLLCSFISCIALYILLLYPGGKVMYVSVICGYIVQSIFD